MRKIAKRILAQAKIYSVSIPQYYYYLFLQPKTVSDKTVCISVKHNHFKRYLYGFIKFFHLGGYSIFLDITPSLFSEMRNEKWESYIFSERLVKLGKPPGNSKVILINETNLSADYFLNGQDQSAKAYHVPMMQHPLMYHAGWWNMPVKSEKRKKSLFMAGNFDEAIYKGFEQEGIFELASRLEVYQYLKKKTLLYDVENNYGFAAFLNSSSDHKVILLNRLKADVHMPELRPTLSRFSFFFALPGIEIPFSHNIIEAISCGCIPFIQESYAKLFMPPLRNGVHAIIFSGLHDIEDQLDHLFSLPDEEIEAMRNAVFYYYNQHLTPGKVVAALEANQFTNICLQAEHESVELAKKRRKSR